MNLNSLTESDDFIFYLSENSLLGSIRTKETPRLLGGLLSSVEYAGASPD